MEKLLSAEANITVRFSEVDMLQIAWHGHYVAYMEEGRIAFGQQYDLGYMQVYAHGYTIPVVRVVIDYKNSLRFGDEAIVKASYLPSQAAKLVFRYEITSKNTGQLLATGETIQVFVDQNGELSITSPPFFEAWKQKWLSH